VRPFSVDNKGIKIKLYFFKKLKHFLGRLFMGISKPTSRPDFIQKVRKDNSTFN
jgi:hypothetical protein